MPSDYWATSERIVADLRRSTGANGRDWATMTGLRAKQWLIFWASQSLPINRRSLGFYYRLVSVLVSIDGYRHAGLFAIIRGCAEEIHEDSRARGRFEDCSAARNVELRKVALFDARGKTTLCDSFWMCARAESLIAQFPRETIQIVRYEGCRKILPTSGRYRVPSARLMSQRTRW